MCYEYATVTECAESGNHLNDCDDDGYCNLCGEQEEEEDITDFFDVYNIDHIVAYKGLLETGKWPEGFIPEGTTFPKTWQIHIAFKMSNAWTFQAMAGNIYGIPAP